MIDVRLDEGTVGETRRVTSSRLRKEKRVGRLGDRFLTAKFRLPLNETVKIESNVLTFFPRSKNSILGKFYGVEKFFLTSLVDPSCVKFL